MSGVADIHRMSENFDTTFSVTPTDITIRGGDDRRMTQPRNRVVTEG
jgi:hypothetical protein